MINFFHRLFLAKTEDDLRLESLRDINEQLKETNDRLEETSAKLKESVDRCIDRLRNKRRTPD
jgi:hypothetical protein